MSGSRDTSLITLITSEHGKMRREQRDISKRDLQKALKHGSRKQAYDGRWKIEYDGVVFITDSSMRREITSFPSPLKLADVSSDMREDHKKAKFIIEQKPELAMSHTVLCIDNSGSMAIHDIHLHRDRQVAAYSMIAIEFVAEQLFSGTANNSDLVSLVEFSSSSKVVFEREPVSWALYNKLLSRRDGRNFVSREHAKRMELLGSDSNYLPALYDAERLLGIGDHDTCALSLLFLSDGSPSDSRHLGLTPIASDAKIFQRIREIADKFGERLEVKMLGFGNEEQDFSVLKAMAQTVKNFTSIERAEFVYCGKRSNALGEAITSLATSLTETRTSLMTGTWGKTKRNVAPENGRNVSSDWRYFPITGHRIYDPKQDRFVTYPGLPPGALRPTNDDEARRRQRAPPKILGISSKFLGQGVERLAFRCQLSDRMGVDGFALAPMVAKETKLMERMEEDVAFHKCFCETQDLASHLADDFNRRLRALPDYDPISTPQITFLRCTVFLLADVSWPDGVRGVLVEKMLDTERFGWRKWNNNAGGVDGRVAHVPIDVKKELAKLESLGVIAEGDSDEESESEEGDSDEESESEEGESDEKYESEDAWKEVEASDFLQAFTHFTYRVTNKKVLVCDLQGVFNTDIVPPTFELTDPAIHYASNRREMVFGRTDKGQKGIQLFFNTHKCSRVCKLMQLSAKNPNWQKDWRRTHDK
jgi:hypothetical protein